MNLKSIALVIATLGLAGCDGSSSAPSAQPASSTSAPPPANNPLPGLQPTITAVSPNVVSTAGTWGTITGTQFQPGTAVRIGGTAIPALFQDSTTLRFSSSGPHVAGSVDISVTNPGGLAATLTRGYTYATADSFDANGEWVAHADAHNDYLVDMRFTIRDNGLVTVSCGTPVTMPTTVPVQSGNFSFAGADGLAMFGTLASTTTSYGQVNAPGCGDGRWWADKVSPSQF